jgi:hypothetical protein
VPWGKEFLEILSLSVGLSLILAHQAANQLGSALELAGYLIL